MNLKEAFRYQNKLQRLMEEHMEKFIPYEKLSKKEQKKRDQARRMTWGTMSPVTRRTESRKRYDRKREQGWKKEEQV